MRTLPHPVDVHVGARLRERRRQLGKSQSALAGAVGLTFQQIQKYERGGNRIGAGRLHRFAEILGVPVSFFFDDLPTDVERLPPASRDAAGAAIEVEVMARRETIDLVGAYRRIADPRVRNGIRALVKLLAETGPDVGDAGGGSS